MDAINILYRLIKKSKNGRSDLKNTERCGAQSDLAIQTRKRPSAWETELSFWKEYAKIYPNLEKAGPYRNLERAIKKLLNPRDGEIWLDVGCGPLRVSELICEKSGGQVKGIEAVDIVLQPAQEKLASLARLGKSLPVNLKCVSLANPLPYPDDFFDGIGANLILPYVIEFQEKKGEEALKAVLQEMFRILKPGGHLVWSTPKYKVNFIWVFIASLPDMLNVYEYIVHRDFSRVLQGTRILRHALTIQKRGEKGIYTFLPKDKLEKLLLQIGFVNPVWEKTFTRQVWVNRVYKPNVV